MKKLTPEARRFYRQVLAVTLPILIQNGITNFVSMLDNIMVGQVGTMEMSGVAIVNQLLFVFNLCVFGATSGAGIFTAQFHGASDHRGIRHTFRFKLLVALALTLAGAGILLGGQEFLIRLFLQGEGTLADVEATLGFGRDYLAVMLWGLLPFAVANAYSSTLRETGESKVPMIAGVVAVGVNLALNYILIFGKCGAPKLGVEGAALATVISRYAELLLMVLWVHGNSGKNPFIRGAYRSMTIPGKLVGDIFAKGMPLLVNEFLWSVGISALNQCYSTRGLDVVAAVNISTTISQLASAVFLALGSAVGILMGQMLGAGRPEQEVRLANKRLMRLSVVSCVFCGGGLVLISGWFPQIYNTTDQVRSIATGLIVVTGMMMPVNSYNNAMYFTLRSGGQTFITFLFDSGFTWVVSVPVAFWLSHFTSLPILPLYAICVGVDVLKIFLGKRILDKGDWIKTIVR